eukprot:1160699-Pelagomonas_calceolata.AAC.5
MWACALSLGLLDFLHPGHGECGSVAWCMWACVLSLGLLGLLHPGHGECAPEKLGPEWDRNLQTPVDNWQTTESLPQDFLCAYLFGKAFGKRRSPKGATSRDKPYGLPVTPLAQHAAVLCSQSSDTGIRNAPRQQVWNFSWKPGLAQLNAADARKNLRVTLSGSMALELSQQ